MFSTFIFEIFQNAQQFSKLKCVRFKAVMISVVLVNNEMDLHFTLQGGGGGNLKKGTDRKNDEI